MDMVLTPWFSLGIRRRFTVSGWPVRPIIIGMSGP